MIDKWIRFITKEQALIGFSLARIFFGVAVLYELIINFSVRHLLWGATGFYPYEDYQNYTQKGGFLTLFDIGSSNGVVDGIFVGGIVVAICYIIGYRTRVMGVLMAALMFSLYFRNPEITHGGDNLLRILFIYMMFANVGAYFSVDAYRRKKEANPTSKSTLFTMMWAKLSNRPQLKNALQVGRDVTVILHNFAWIACVVQLVFLYFASGTYKLAGEMWQSGTALYYASRVQDFYTPYLSDWLWRWEPIAIAMTYFAVLFQVAFPFLLLNRSTKYVAIFSAVMLHFGIAMFMGLADFSWIMIGSELLLLLDHEYRKVNRWLTGWVDHIKTKPKEETTIA